MFTESRKIQLLEDVIKTSNEETLAEIEAVLKRSRKKVAAKKNKPTIYDFVGILTKKKAKK